MTRKVVEIIQLHRQDGYNFYDSIDLLYFSQVCYD